MASRRSRESSAVGIKSERASRSDPASPNGNRAEGRPRAAFFTWGRPSALAAALVALGGIVSAGGEPAAERSLDADKQWRDGPVQYLLTSEEYRRFGRLKTEEARRGFIERFWKRLDSDPSTPENEYRDRFEALCKRAEEAFQEGPSAGWKTDRGRVLLLLGEPDAVRRDAGDAWGRDREIWTYERLRGAGSAPIEIRFHRNADGQFRLGSGRPEPASEDPVERERRRQEIRRQLRQQYLGMSPVALEQLTQLLVAPPPTFFNARPEQERRVSIPLAPSRSPTAVPFEPSRLREASYFFESSDGSVLALLALEFEPDMSGGAGGGEAATPFVARAWVLHGDPQTALDAWAGAAEVELARIESDSPYGTLLFVGRVHLEPGPYGVRYAVADPTDRSLKVRSVDILVPELGTGEFSASSVIPAERFGKAAEPSVFAVGSEEVVPRPGGRFRRSEPLRIYLQVYGAAEDPLAGKARVDVRFSFERASRGRYRSHGRPLLVREAEGASMGLALPIGDWPTGDYRVLVRLHDRVSGSRTSAEGSFVITD